MKKKRKKVLCIDSDPAFLDHQKKKLGNKKLDNSFYCFTDFWAAYHFIEKQVIAQNQKIHYILLDEKILGRQLISSLEKISSLKNFMRKPDVIIFTPENNIDLRNKVMQFPVVSAILEKPVPENYIEFLITGQPA